MRGHSHGNNRTRILQECMVSSISDYKSYCKDNRRVALKAVEENLG